MIDRDARRSILLGLGAAPAVADELLTYNENVFRMNVGDAATGDEPFVDAWRSYAREAGESGAFECLRHRLIQFQFPIRAGISMTAIYQRATRRGELPRDEDFGGGLELHNRDGLRIEIHPSAAGHIPLLITTSRADFATLVRALTRRNEPDFIPDSMGACMVAGYTNWDRIRAYRESWERRHPDAVGASWPEELRRLAAHKHRYQDRFIVLSDGPYSAVDPETLGLSDETWRAYSLIIRKEHECAHYFTRRVLGSMRNNVLDEMIADYMGILEIAGHFRADWFLQFMGLERFPHYRTGGRLENYLGDLSEEAGEVLRCLVVRAALQLERSGPRYRLNPAPSREKARVLNILAGLTLEEMASARIVTKPSRELAKIM